MSRKKRVLIDMDGVLTQFVPAVFGLINVKFDEGAYPAGEFDIAKVLEIKASAMWRVIDSELTFWENLNSYPWMAQLILEVEQLGLDWMIATSPSSDPASASGKVEWLQNVFGRRFRRFMIGPQKELMANAETLLIDDGDHNINKFHAAGGEVCTFPQPWNRLHEECGDRIGYVRSQLEAFV